MAAPLGSMLWRHLRVYHVYGANTDVGKTVLTTGLSKTATKLWNHEHSAFLKPVSAGPRVDADDQYTETLFHYDLAASPHLAARVSKKPIPSDEGILERIRQYASHRAARGPGWLFIETAGGIHSPGPSGTTQVDLYRPLRLPVILVGDAKLGGISQTISAFESLKSRGYDVEVVLVFHETQYKNADYLTDYFDRQHGIPVMTVAGPPMRDDRPTVDQENMSRYYEAVSSQQEARDILGHLDRRHIQRIVRLESMSQAAHRQLWYPFTQHKQVTPQKITVIDSAHGNYFQTLVPPDIAKQEVGGPTALLQPSFDGSASWWTQGLGHGNPSLSLAAAYAAGRYGHVMFPEAVHEPALALTEMLLQGLQNPRLTRVFFSDNGSTGVEVALKMALRAARLAFGVSAEEKLGVLGLKGSYHGDTIGAMDAAEPCAFNEKVEWYEGKGFWFDYPTVICTGGKWTVQVPDNLGGSYTRDDLVFPSLADIFDYETRESTRAYEEYEKYITQTLESLQTQQRRFGALIVEPVVLGAGGMLLVDPLFQRALVNVVRKSPHLFATSRTTAVSDPVLDGSSWTGLPVIFDEVFTGLYRLGRFTASSFLGVHADVSVHSKLLTGGLVPLCATVASESIFRAFESDNKSDALLHGHSYTAHAVGCQVALETLRDLQRTQERGDWDWAKSAGGWASTVAGDHGRNHSHAVMDKSAGTVFVWSVWSREFVLWLSQQTAAVEGAWALGSVLAIHVKSLDGIGYKSNAAREIQSALFAGSDTGEGHGWNVHSRVLGNVLYLMSNQKSRGEEIKRIEGLLREILSYQTR